MTTLGRSLLAQLRNAADPARAPAMQAYMKSAMPYLGVSAVALRQVCKAAFAGLSWPDSATWQAEVLAIWQNARFREERYAAIELTALKAVRGFQQVDALPMYEQMVVSGAWWDTVDPIATQRFWMILQNDRNRMKPTMLGWSGAPDLWKRRCAILCQNPAKRETDLEFLYACIEPSLDSKEFFLRKAIGWALRQYARTDPSEIERYVTANRNRLSGLSKREALKNVPKLLGAAG